MSTFTYDFASEDQDAWFLVLITYHYEPGEIQRGERGSYWCPGTIDIESVQVMEFERYNDDGKVVEEWKQGHYWYHGVDVESVAFTARQRELDALAFDKIVEEANEWGHLAELLAGVS